jgi:ABC-2 type transport system ATP-binding protein
VQHTIRVANLSHQYKSHPALQGISFEVEQGELFGFLGPNGAGKTTTIRILTAQMRPTGGKAWVMGCDVVSERQKLKPQIGVVFDVQNLYDRSTARENLQFYARLYGVHRECVDRVLEDVDLSDRARDKVKAYSNGMKQRLLIARALLHQPSVLFLDEPTRGLDPHAARDIRAIVSGLADQGVTVFLTTHYMEEADQLCQRVAILDRGEIVALDTPAHLKAAHGGEQATLEDVFVNLTGRGLSQEAQ